MTRVGKSRSTVLVVLAAALALVAMPASAPAQGPDEYSLNLPDGGGGETDPSAGGGSEPVDEGTPAAPVSPTAPVAPVTEVTESGEVVIVDGNGGKKPKPDKPDPVFGSTSPNGTLGPQRVPTLKVPEGEESSSLIPIGLAGLAGICCLLAVWRLRYRREEPTAPAPPAQTKAQPAARRARPPRESAAAARVRRGRTRAPARTAQAKKTARSRAAARGAASS